MNFGEKFVLFMDCTTPSHLFPHGGSITFREAILVKFGEMQSKFVEPYRFVMHGSACALSSTSCA